MTRWTRRLLVGAIAMLVPALAGCEAGLNAPTLQYHSASSGTSTTINGIELDNVFVLGPALNQTLPAGGQAGVFLAMSSQTRDLLVSASAPGAANSVQLLNGPVTLRPGELVNLSGPAPLIVLNGLTNPLSGGETISLVLTFASAGALDPPSSLVAFAPGAGLGKNTVQAAARPLARGGLPAMARSWG